MKKGFAPIIIILVLCILVLFVIFIVKSGILFSSKYSPFFLPTQPVNLPVTNETENPDLVVVNWKTYTNTKYKFSFKYPPNWKDLSIESLLSLNNGQDEGLSMKVDRTFDDINRYLDYVKRADTELEKITEAKKINLDGIEGYRLTYTEYRPVTNEIKREHYNVIFINDKENIELFFKGKKETLDQILSTFKFE